VTTAGRALAGAGAAALWLALLALSASCIDEPSSPRVACDDLRDAFVARSASLGCGFGGADYTCTALGGGRTCSAADIDACMGAIDGATECRFLGGASNCVLHCE